MAIQIYTNSQKIVYKYSKNGLFQAKFSGNISAATFAGNNESTSFQAQLAAIQNLSSSLKKLDDYAFYCCYNMVSANLGSGIESIGCHCFEKCQNLQALYLPRECQSIEDQAFSTSRTLHEISYIDYEKDSSLDYSESAFSLSYLGSSIISGTPMLSNLVFPNSITSVTSQTSPTMLQGASLSSITFLGMTSSDLEAIQPQIASTQMLGLSNDCEIIASDGKKLKYTNNGGSLVVDESFSIYGNSRIQSGRLNKLKLGKSLYWFTKHLYQWCMDTSIQDPEKFPKPSQCPFIVFYGDFLTSSKTKTFLHQILENSDFRTWIKDTLKCFLFILDRNGNILNGSGDEDLQFFRDVHRERGGTEDFVIVDFFYGSHFWSSSFKTGLLDDLKRIIEDGMAKCNFSSFDPTQYECVLNALDPETIPTSGADPTQLRSWCGGYPWWFNGTTAAKGTTIKLSSQKFNFQVLSTPETTYLLVGAYDQNNPHAFPKNIQSMTTQIWTPYADIVKEIYDTDCTNGGFTKLFEEGPKYRHFICFEFSHGAHELITIDKPSLSYKKIWEVLKDCRGKVFIMFDSCESGSMFQAKQMLASSTEENNYQDDVGLGTYLVQHFQRRSQLMQSLFGATTEDIDPQIICWSSTTSSDYGWYYPTKDTIYAEALRKADEICQGKRYLPTFLVVREKGYFRGAIPQRKSYQTKDGVAIIGECRNLDDNGVEIDAEKCIIWS